MSASEVVGPAPPRATSAGILPLVRDGRVDAVVALWRDARPITSALADARRDILLVTMTAAGLVALILWLVFRSAQGLDHRARPSSFLEVTGATR